MTNDRNLLHERRPYSYGWSWARDHALARDGYRCQAAGDHHGRLSVHHITPLRHGGRHDVTNLRTLCRKHHDEAEAEIEELVISLPDAGDGLAGKILIIARELGVPPLDWVRNALLETFERDYEPTRELFRNPPPLDDATREFFEVWEALL